MKIFIRPKTVYDRKLYYPDCATSELFCRLTGTKTLTPEALTIIKQLGYDLCVKTMQVVSVDPRTRFIH